MRSFFLTWPIRQTVSGELASASLEGSALEEQVRPWRLDELAQVFALPWSTYARLLSVKDDHARRFYEAEALRGGWSVRQLDRQINSQFYERTALSKNKATMLVKGAVPKSIDVAAPGDAIKDGGKLPDGLAGCGSAAKGTGEHAPTDRISRNASPKDAQAIAQALDQKKPR
jgi:hypothetical protein